METAPGSGANNPTMERNKLPAHRTSRAHEPVSQSEWPVTRCQDKGTNHTPYVAPYPSTPPALASPYEQDAAEETELLPPSSLLHPHGRYANNYSVGWIYTPFVHLHTFPPAESKYLSLSLCRMHPCRSCLGCGKHSSTAAAYNSPALSGSTKYFGTLSRPYL